MRAACPDISERQTCRVFKVARAALHRQTIMKPASPKLAEGLVRRLYGLIQQYPTYGYRQLWALLRYREGLVVNRKAVYRALRLKRWLVHQRTRTPRPRVPRLRSRAAQSNQRWAMDVTHIPCGRDGWGHLTAVIDCHDREIVAMNLPCAGGRRKPNGLWKRRAWLVSEPSVRQKLRRFSGATTA